MIGLSAGKAVLRAVYRCHKLATTRPERICIISRQADEPSLDITMLKEALEKRHHEYEVLVL